MRILVRRRRDPDQLTVLWKSRWRALRVFALLSFAGLFLVSVAAAEAGVCEESWIDESGHRYRPERWSVLVLDSGPTPAEKQDGYAIADLFQNKVRSREWHCWTHVFYVSNVGNDEMVEALKRFEPLSVDADLALVFYSGNADATIRLSGDDRFSDLPELPNRAVPLPFDRILPAIASAKRQIVILDTDLPDVIAENVAGNQLIAYAGAPGGVIFDSIVGETISPFTQALLEHLPVPGRSVREVFDRVGMTVRERTDQQTPFFTLGWDEPYVLVREPLSLASTEAVGVLPVTASVPEAVIPVEAKLDGALLAMVHGQRDGPDAGALSAGDRVAVEIVCESRDDIAAVWEQVVAAGGAVTASFENYLWVDVPLTAVEGLATTSAVWTMALNRAVVRPMR